MFLMKRNVASVTSPLFPYSGVEAFTVHPISIHVICYYLIVRHGLAHARASAMPSLAPHAVPSPHTATPSTPAHPLHPRSSERMQEPAALLRHVVVDRACNFLLSSLVNRPDLTLIPPNPFQDKIRAQPRWFCSYHAIEIQGSSPPWAE